MTITVRYFASLRERLGSEEAIAFQPGLTVAALRDQLIARGGAHAEVLDSHRLVRCAVNKTMCGENTPIEDGAEIAFFPPVTGG